MSQEDTIFALSSGGLPAAIAVIRVSGPGAHAVAGKIAGALPPPRAAVLRTLRDPSRGEPLDEALLLRFDRPASATGEDLVEFQCHGSRAVIDAIADVLTSFAGVRPALPGEFTRRALANGRIDLTEAEGLADLLEAETEAQRRSAMAMAGGHLRRHVAQWQDRLLSLAAQAEAAIDYDEDDEVTVSAAPLLADMADLAGEIAALLAAPSAERLRDGVRVVIAGPVNAGKSSLFNRLLGDERAIVTAIAGTTRDTIEMPVAMAGVPLLLVDTAGQRQTEDLVENIGVGRARREMERADLILWLGEPAESPPDPRIILVSPKVDICPARPAALAVSAETGEGIETLAATIVDRAKAMLPRAGEVALNRRQRALLAEAHHALTELPAGRLELLADNLRCARGAFHRLTGQAGVDEMLDKLFSRFCLGK